MGPMSVPPEQAAACPDQTPPRGHADPTKTVRAYLAATAARDLDAAATLVADDSIVFESGGDEGTWAHYREHHLGPEVELFSAFELEMGAMRVSAGRDGTLAVVTVPVEYDVTLRDARHFSSVGTVTFVLRLAGPDYKIEHVHWSSRRRAPPDDPVAVEHAAYERAKPVFERHCAGCHQQGQPKATKKALTHFDMTTYPFGGHHARDIDVSIRKVLGADGGKPTMPKGKAAGSVRGEDLAAILTWTEAFAAAKASGSHGVADEHGGHAH